MNMEVDLDGIFLRNDSYDYEDYEYKEEVEPVGGAEVFLSVLYSLVLVVGLCGTGLLLAVLALKRRSLSLSDTFILHLSVADVLLLMTLPFWAVQEVHHHGWGLGNFLCKLSGAVFNLNFYCGIFLLVCITLDRYLSVVHTIQLFSHKKPRFVHISFLIVWIVSLILTIPAWIHLAENKDQIQKKTLCYHGKLKNDQLLVSRLPHHTLGFLLPAAVLIIGCSYVLLRLQRSSKGLQKHRAFIMGILPLIVAFFLCWVPYNITLIVDTYRSYSEKPGDVQTGDIKGSLQRALTFTKALCFIQACLRPLLYFGLCANFRKQVLNVMRGATVEQEGSLWELGLGEEAPCEQSKDEEEEKKQMTTVDHQMQSTQC